MNGYQAMTKDEAEDFMGDLFLGRHHIPSEVKPWGTGWQVNSFCDMSTYDFDRMTRLVFLAHDRCVRAEISWSGPRRIRIIIHKRDPEGTSMTTRHPTIEQALARWRERNEERKP